MPRILQNLLLAVLVALCACASPSTAAATPMFHDIFTVDCNGGVHAFSSHQFMRQGINLQHFKRVYEYFVSYAKSNAKCHCDALTEEQLDAGFSPTVGMLLKALTTPQASDADNLFTTDCGGDKAFTWSFLQMVPDNVVELPGTCTYEKWAKGEACYFELNVPGLEVQLQVAIDHCSTSETSLPYINVGCKGAICDDLMRPCKVDADCSAGTCAPMYAADNLPATGKIGKELVDALKSLKVYPEEGKSGPFTKTADECAAFQPANIGKTLIAEAFNFLGKYTGYKGTAFDGASVESPKFCGLAAVSAYAGTAPFRGDCPKRYHKCESKTSTTPTPTPVASSSPAVSAEPAVSGAPAASSSPAVTAPPGRRLLQDGTVPQVPITSEGQPTTDVQEQTASTSGTNYASALMLLNPGLLPIAAAFGITDSSTNVETDTCRCKYELDMASPFFDNAAVVTPGVGGAARRTEYKQRDAWDGTNAAGVNVHGDRKQGKGLPSFAKPSAGVNVMDIIEFSCASRLSVFGHSPLSIQAYEYHIHAMISKLTDTVVNIVKCRLPNLTREQIVARFAFWETSGVMHAISGSKVDLGRADKVSDFYEGVIEGLANGESDSTKRLKMAMPGSCSFETWRDSGECKFQYSNLKGLLNSDITLRFKLKKCTGSPGALPAIHFSCVGIDCEKFIEIYDMDACAVDGDCSSGKCMDMPGKLPRIATFYEEQLDLTDCGSASGICGVPVIADKCQTEVIQKENFMQMVRKVLDKPPFSADVFKKAKIGMCMPEVIKTISETSDLPENKKKWAESAFKLDELTNTMYLTGLENYRYARNEIDDVDDKPFSLKMELKMKVTDETDFNKKFAADIAKALRISASRVVVNELEAAGDNTVIMFSIMTNGGGENSNEMSPAEAVEELQSQLMIPTSPIYAGEVTKSAEANVEITNFADLAQGSAAASAPAVTITVLGAALLALCFSF